MSRRTDTKSQIFIMEFIVVVLFFSLCVGTCISGFVKANRISEDSKAMNHGILLAQSAAECIKVSDYEDIDAKLNRLVYPVAEQEGYHLDVSKSMDKQMLTAVITVWNERGTICELSVKKYVMEERAADVQ